jgi:hypothetical protein
MDTDNDVARECLSRIVANRLERNEPIPDVPVPPESDLLRVAREYLKSPGETSVTLTANQVGGLLVHLESHEGAKRNGIKASSVSGGKKR